MIDLQQLRDCYVSTPSKIVMLVADGLGGVPHPDTRKSELEAARIPNLNALAGRSACGLTVPVLPGITPGSGPGHLALFGYDPLKYVIGRGVLEALGIDVPLKKGDVAARGNFCTVDSNGLLTDRRAGRIPTELSAPLAVRLDTINVPGVELSAYPVKDHRFVLVLRGQGLDDRVSETDPQRTGVAPLDAQALAPEAKRTAQATNEFTRRARELLRGEERANMVLLRGFSQLPHLPPMGVVYRLVPAAIAAYPMYRGLARVVGMEVILTGATFADEVATLEAHFAEHDFFFLHYKPTDAAGEDGNFDGKVKALEALDEYIPRILALKPDVLMVAGDHATPSLMASHSWHPVPFMLHSRLTLGEGVEGFNERACARGSLGTFPAVNIMLLALSHAGKLTKFGP
ncbi:MAG: 2,3-bisphosphoglycerate-independent phosphoglycerate mutase [Chloroflexota bacterium]|nr:2,3-bisphosphoglycerate-independent phosphoglycerate mutase [Chloroflexota bacterium]